MRCSRNKPAHIRSHHGVRSRTLEHRPHHGSPSARPSQPLFAAKCEPSRANAPQARKPGRGQTFCMPPKSAEPSMLPSFSVKGESRPRGGAPPKLLGGTGNTRAEGRPQTGLDKLGGRHFWSVFLCFSMQGRRMEDPTM